MRRHPENPLLEPSDVPPSNPSYRVRGVFNPAAVQFGEDTLLLLRVAEDVPSDPDRVAVPIVRFDPLGGGHPDVLEVARDDPAVRLKDTRGLVYQGADYLSTMSHLRLARSRDGIHFTVDTEPFLFPANPSEVFGVEDARITRLDDTYWINYTCVSGDGWATALASTRDFRTVQRHGIILPPQNKDASLFPRKIGGLYAALHRPNNEGFGKPSIWYATSPDLIHWGDHRCIARPREMPEEALKIGGGPPSLETEAGWLQLYHAKGKASRYSMMTLLLDRDDPSQVLRRSQSPVLEPEQPYETDGFFPNVVFSNGWIADPGGRIRVYYGACDGVTCLAETTVEELLAAAD